MARRFVSFRLGDEIVVADDRDVVVFKGSGANVMVKFPPPQEPQEHKNFAEYVERKLGPAADPEFWMERALRSIAPGFTFATSSDPPAAPSSASD
jgi:hypothetical protein